MIEFRKLILHNFMSYKHAVVQLAKQGVVRIEGINEDEPSANSNMAGKSTLMEALLWCLFGRTLRGLKHESVVNRKAKRNCFVSTTFTSNGTIYICRRNRRHKKYGNKLQLFRKDTLLSSRHGVDTQRRLEGILDVDFESFVNSTVFGGFDGQRKQFALQTDSQQKAVFDSFLKFEKFEIALARTKKVLVLAKEQHHELQLKVQAQHGLVSTVQGKIKTLKKSQKILGEDDKRELRKLVRRTLGKAKGDNLDELKQSTEKIIERKAGAESRMEAIQHQLRILTKKQLNKEQMMGKPCPACGRVVKEKTLTAVLKHLGRDKILLKLEKRVVVKVLKKLERRLYASRQKLKMLEKQKEGYQILIARKKELEKKLRVTQAPFSEEIESAQVDYSKQLSRLLAYEFEEGLVKNKIKDLEFWDKGFGNKGVKTLIVKEVLPAMNKKLKEYSQEIFQSGVELEFKANKVNKSGDERELYHLHYRTRLNSNNYMGESSGGRRRVDICVLLVFAWLSRTCNLLLVDELLDGLDDAGRETVLSILSRQRGTVLVISHSKDLKSKIGQVWTVRKSNGTSTLELDA